MTDKNKLNPMNFLAPGAAFISFFVCYYIFHFLCRDFVLSNLMAAAVAFFVFKLLPAIQMTSDPTILTPNPKLYNLTPMYAMPEVKDALTARYFGDKRWHFDDANPSKNTIACTCKFVEDKVIAEQRDRKDYTITLKIFFEPLGDGCTARLHYEVIGQTQNKLINDLCQATTEVIETDLKALEKRLHG